MRIHRSMITCLAAAPLALAVSAAFAQNITHVPMANPKAPGLVTATRLSPELAQIARAQGAMRLENPSSLTSFYGYDNDGPMVPPPGAVQVPGVKIEATKTEPDKNTYLVLEGLAGADSRYDYGKRFLFQGHEGGINDATTLGGRNGYITRINLDADGAHRVTLLASTDVNGKALPVFDGSTWYPWARKLLLSAENGASGGIWQADPTINSKVEDLSGAMGRGGYEGVQADSDGNIWIVEDASGPTVAGAKVPNGFLYRFIPYNKADLTKGGKLQALQVMSKATPGQPIAFNAASALTPDVKDLHTYGMVFDTTWVTLHDTATDGNTPFDANALAKNRKATPFKRPENGVFRPGTRFREFFFDETGDTSATSSANGAYGGWGSVMKLTQANPSANSGKLTMFFLGDQVHSGFDNIQFWDEHRLGVVEDAGDTLHAQRNALDSGYLFDVRTNYSNPAAVPTRFLAEGRDSAATADSPLTDGRPANGFQNDGDNEITGFHVSDGDPGVHGILGAKIPQPFNEGWRVFYTQQHGDNVTYEIVRSRQARTGRDEDDHGEREGRGDRR